MTEHSSHDQQQPNPGRQQQADAAPSSHAGMAHTPPAATPTPTGMSGGGGMSGHGAMAMRSSATGPQVAVMTILTVLALTTGVLISAYRANLTLSADDVGGLVMPPGMIMGRETTAEAMQDMAAVRPDDVSYTAPGDAQGDQALMPRIEDGVKVFDLEASVIEWSILPDARVMAYAFNRQVPGPRIRITEGDRVRFNVTNDLPEATSVHWHGLILPNDMDGAAEITQDPI